MSHISDQRYLDTTLKLGYGIEHQGFPRADAGSEGCGVVWFSQAIQARQGLKAYELRRIFESAEPPKYSQISGL